MKTLQTQLSTLRAYRKVPDWHWAKQISQQSIPLGSVWLEPNTGNLFLKALNISVSKEKQEFLLDPQTLKQAQSLQRTAQAQFSLSSDGELCVEVEGIKVLIQTKEEIEILEEIFLQGVYNFTLDRPMVIWDIGMNAGIASLYFARNPNVVAVMGYEPFLATYQQACRNVALNPTLASKIQPFSYGLGQDSRDLTVEYTADMRGSVGVHGLPERFKAKNNFSFVKETIHLEPAPDVLDRIHSTYPNAEIVAKIDCEGSEYEILPALANSGKLGLIRAILLEWHEQGPEPIVDFLRQAGFAIFSRRPKSKTIGLIHAVRI